MVIGCSVEKSDLKAQFILISVAMCPSSKRSLFWNACQNIPVFLTISALQFLSFLSKPILNAEKPFPICRIAFLFSVIYFLRQVIYLLMSLIACSDSSMSLSDDAFLLKVRFLISRGVNRDVSTPRYISLFSFCIVRDLVLVMKFDCRAGLTGILFSFDQYEAASSFWFKSSKLVTWMSLNELITFNCGFSLIFISLLFSSSSI